mmetsp:Transcript_61127/g.101694  ORF Transcript_61127/g.101694 Transcript_61127/m.101694 type:complete len:255 (-) Transcript_61127:132-896(-)
MEFKHTLKRSPIIAILAELSPDRAADVGAALVAAGVEIIEVPLRGNDVSVILASVKVLVDTIGDRAIIGAGTVVRVAQVEQVAAVGARLVVSPNMDPTVIAATKMAGMLSVPGVYTPTEAFIAINAGADALKWFPTDGSSPLALKAMVAVLPADVPVLAVGGVNVQNVGTWWLAGAAGFGVGSAIWKRGATATQVGSSAQAFVVAINAARKGAAGQAESAVTATGTSRWRTWLAVSAASVFLLCAYAVARARAR